MNVFDFFGQKSNPIVLDICVGAFEPPLDTENLFNTVVVVERHHDFTDDYIETWAETTTCHDYSLAFFRLVENVIKGTGFLEHKVLDYFRHVFVGSLRKYKV